MGSTLITPVAVAAPVTQTTLRDDPMIPSRPPVPTAPTSLFITHLEDGMSVLVGDEAEADDEDDPNDIDTMEEDQFVMDGLSDDDDEGRRGVAYKKSKKSPGSHLYDPLTGLSKEREEISQSLFGNEDPVPSSDPPDLITSTDMEHAFRRVSVASQDTMSVPVLTPSLPRSPYSSVYRHASATEEETRVISSSAPTSSRGSSYATPPPIPPNAVPYIVAGTPDLIGEVSLPAYSPHHSEHSLHMFSSSFDSNTSPPLESTLEDKFHQHPPSFHDAVKRSTRFITSVPAGEVLETVENILEQCRQHRTVSPIGLIGRVEMHWESYRLDVWGVVSGQGNPPLCSLHLYQLPQSASPMSPPRDILNGLGLGCSPNMSGTSLGASYAPPQQLYLVEFVRGQLEIFQFKRFYEWVRQKVSELVKRDYAFSCLDQAGSPM